jgi:hypothetical protein
MSIRRSLQPQRRRGTVKTAGGTSRRRNPPRPVLDRLEDRCLLAVTTTQGLPVVATEGAQFSGTVAKFTSNDVPPSLLNFSANIDWGNGTSTINAFIVNDPILPGVFDVLGNITYAEEGTFPVTVSIHDAPPVGIPGDAVAASVATVSDAALAAAGVGSPIFAEGTLVPFNGVVASFADADPNGTAADYAAMVNWGDGTITQGAITAGAPGLFNVTGQHAYEESLPGTPYLVAVNITDSGGAKALATSSFTITDPNPVVAAIAPATLAQVEGQSFTAAVGAFTDPNPLGAASDFSATIHWGDGTTSAGLIAAQPGGTFTVTGTHTYAEETTGGPANAVTFDVNDVGGGALAGAAGVTVTVNDGPLVANGINLNAVEGSPTSIPAGTVVATFTDADPAGTATDYAAVIEWGDGTSGPGTVTPIAGTPGSFSVTAAAGKVYSEEGNFNFRVTISDTGGATASAGGTANVTDAPLSAVGTPQGGTVITEGAPVTIQVASFTDADTTNTPGDPNTNPADYTAIIAWGDGTSSPGAIAFDGLSGFNVSGIHTYVEETTPGSPYQVSVLIKDVGGATASANTTLTVGDALLSVAASPAQTATEGKPFTAQVGAFTDANPLGTVSDFSVTIHWGDSTTSPGAVSQLANGTFTVTGTHTYAEESPTGVPDAVTIDVKDVGGSTLTGATGSLVTVNDAPLEMAGSSIQGTEGIPLVGAPTLPNGLLVATLADSNPGANVADFSSGGGSVTVDWGDSTPLVIVPAARITAIGSPSGVAFEIFPPTHSYAESGSYKITVVATDDGGSTAVAHSEADIADAVLSPMAPQPPVSLAEAPLFPVPVFAPPAFSGAIASFTDANPLSTIADFKAEIDWGDHTPLAAGTVTAGVGTANYLVSGAHTYADSGVNGLTGQYSIQVFVVDDDGSILTVDNTANVTDDPIVLNGALNPKFDSGVSNSDAITNVKQPDFFGKSEAFSHVTVFATPSGGGPAALIGQTQAGSDGSWNIRASVPLADGSYVITASAVDQFGVTTTPAPVVITPKLVIDTVGPVIKGAFFNRLNGEVDYTILDASPASRVNIATLLDSSNYELSKVHPQKNFPGKYIVTNVIETPGAAPNSIDVAVTFNNGRQIRGGFYLFRIRDSSNGNSSVQDIAGNHLDGVFYGTFPSGNGIPGSDFVAELDGYHAKIFAPQTIVGTASAANGGVGGAPVGAVHSGVFTPVIPVGGGSVFGSDPKHLKGSRAQKTHTTVKVHGVVHQAEAKVSQSSHPKGPLHR